MALRSGSKVRSFFLYCLAPVACSLAAGYLYYQGNVLNRYSGAFQFLSSSVIASVYYYLRLFVRPRDAVVGLLMLLVLTILSTGSTQPAYLLRDVLYVATIGTSMELYVRFFRSGAQGRFFSPAVTIAGLYALCSIVVAALHIGIIQSSGMAPSPGTFISLSSTEAFFGALIGGAVGIGIALGEKVLGTPPHVR